MSDYFSDSRLTLPDGRTLRCMIEETGYINNSGGFTSKPGIVHYELDGEHITEAQAMILLGRDKA